jgi:hypothetical protein
MKDIYDNAPIKIKRAPRNMDGMQFHPRLGRITKLRDKFRVDIILQSGEIFENVRIPGPSLSEKGKKVHGKTYPIQKDQLVLVGFVMGSHRAPIILRAYSHNGIEEDIENVREFWDEFSSKFDMENDIVDFHKSGYFIRQTTDKIEIYNKDKELIGEIDFSAKKLTWKLEDIDIESNLKIKGDIEIEGKIKSKGDFELDGKLSATGLISSDDDLEASGIKFKPHNHQYSPGPSPAAPTGPAQPGGA